MRIYGTIMQKEAVVRQLEEFSNYITSTEGSGVFVSVAGEGRKRRGVSGGRYKRLTRFEKCGCLLINNGIIGTIQRGTSNETLRKSGFL